MQTTPNEAALDQGFLKNKWSRNTKHFEKYLKTTDMKQADINDMKLRMLMHDKVGNNQDYLGQLSEANAITIMPGLKPL